MFYQVVSRVLTGARHHSLIAGLWVLSTAGGALANTVATPAQSVSSSETAPVAVPAKSGALGEQRYHYNLAKSALNSRKWNSYEENYALLGDYPLTPYLDYTKIRLQLSELPYADVDRFFATYPDAFLAFRLRQIWLSQLAARKQWPAYVTYYRPEVADTELECHYIYARLQTGNADALQETARVWEVGESQPKACDPLFDQWRKAGLLTQELVWSRFTKAVQRRNLGLAGYLAKMLKDDRQALAQLYLQVDRQPSLMKQHSKFREQTAVMQQVIAHGTERLARSNARAALTHWEVFEAQHLFDEGLSRDTKVTLVRYLTRQGHHAEAEQLLEQSAALRQTDVVEELIREALREMDWQAVDRRIAMLPAAEQSNDRWQYWRARAAGELAADSLADSTDTTTADLLNPTQVYEQLAGKRSFYGFLAADILGREYALEDVPVEVRPEALEAIAQMPGMRRARELWLNGSHAEAQAEWMFTTRNLKRDELVSAGQLARQWGWYNKGIHAMISGDLWDHLSIRFPLAYQEEVTRIATNTQIEPTLIYAIARQESAFAEDARSPAGARGLMQLMPSTAEQTARQNGVKYTLQDLYNPEQNIMLGSRYLNSLLQRFNNNRILAAAAYNAGPHRVSRWISDPEKERPYDVWIETIPFHETRGYVQNVLAYSVIYGYRLGQSTSLITASEAQDLL